MKVSNITHLTVDPIAGRPVPRVVYLKDLKLTPEAVTEGRRSEDVYLDPVGMAPLVRTGINDGSPNQTVSLPRTFIYLPDTSEVLRSASFGDIRRLVTQGLIALHDTLSLDAVGGLNASAVITHNLNYAPTVVVYKQVGVAPVTWVDAVGAVDVVHNAAFTQMTVSNPCGIAMTYLVKIS